VINSRNVTVPAGGETTVRFEHNVVAPGTYTARVDGETATVRVRDPGETPAPSTTGATSTTFPGFGPAVALVALLLAALALARRD
jgi:PGF-CTERM protein